MPEVASQMVRPCRSAAIQSAFGTRTPDVVPFQVKTTSREKSTLAKIGQLTVSGLDDAHVAELQLLDDIDHPILAEGFPGQDVHTARPSSDHNAISTAPVSEPETMATR